MGDDSKQSDEMTWRKLIIAAVVLLVGVLLFVFYGEALSLEQLAQRESQLRGQLDAAPVVSFIVAFLLYVVVTGLSLPGAVVMTVVYAWLFGFWQGMVLVSFASTAGATVAFLMSRYFFRDAVESRFGKHLVAFQAALKREGAFYLFSLRLIPAVPFFVINLVMGLTQLPVRTYWWVSQLGMLPGTAAYMYAGANLPNLQTLRDRDLQGLVNVNILIALAVLGTLPLITRRILQRMRQKRSSAKTEQRVSS